jgi:hypothetical protein
MLIDTSFDPNWFSNRLEQLNRSPETKAYIVGVLNRFMISPVDDLSQRSIVLEFLEAKMSGDFSKFCRIGDWALWSLSFKMHDSLVESLGRQAYATCYRLLDKKWAVFHELATDLPTVTRDLKTTLTK